MIKEWFVRSEINKLESVFWNTVGAGLSAIQAAIILVFISRIYGLRTAGILTISYAVANVIMTAAKYGIRSFQVTDINREYGFGDYFFLRIITVCLGLIFGLCFSFFNALTGSYDHLKAVLVFEVTCLKLVDALEDVYLGEYQQAGHFITGAKMMAVRQIAVTVTICAGLTLKGSVPIVFAFGTMLSFLLLSVFIRMVNGELSQNAALSFDFSRVKMLSGACFPLFIGTTLAIYVGNIPKYAIDMYSTEEVQAVFGYLMLPVFIVTLASQFIYLPFIRDFGEQWEKGEFKSFLRRIMKQCVYIVIVTLVVLFAGNCFGLKLISVIYGTDLTVYTKEFDTLLLGGSLYTFTFFLTVPLTAMRRQRVVEAGFIIASAAALIIQKYAVISGGMAGAAILYLVINFLALLIFGSGIIMGIKAEISHIP